MGLDTEREIENMTAVEWDGRDLLAEIDTLREALVYADDALQWIRAHYPKALVAMPTDLYLRLRKANLLAEGRTKPRLKP
jgi:hypothetical protein